jgi:nitrogen fixation protein FixH
MTAKSPALTGRHMWMLLGGFFGTVIAMNTLMAVMSSTSWTGLVVENSYVASQEFEGRRLAHEAQQAAGWQATFTYQPGIAKLVVVDGAGKRLDLGPVVLNVNRPVGGHDDQAVSLQRAPDGGYAADLKLGSGLWDVLIEAAQTPKGPFELHERFRVGPEQ